MHLSEVRISIAGLGLMGGSLASALSGRCSRLTGFDQNPETRALAHETGWFDCLPDTLPEAIEESDLLILAVPVRSILDILHGIGRSLPVPGAVIDLGSTKSLVYAAMTGLPKNVDALAGHPMCGKEVSGIAAADRDLYSGCNFVLCPLDRTSSGLLDLAHEIIAELHAHPLIIKPDLHDQLTALTSHLPYLLAATLVHTAAGLGTGKPVWDLASSGFRDTSRVAASSLPMMLDILLTNPAPVLDAVRNSQAFLNELAAAMENQNRQHLEDLLNPSRNTRAGLFIQQEKEGTP